MQQQRKDAVVPSTQIPPPFPPTPGTSLARAPGFILYSLVIFFACPSGHHEPQNFSDGQFIAFDGRLHGAQGDNDVSLRAPL